MSEHGRPPHVVNQGQIRSEVFARLNAEQEYRTIYGNRLSAEELLRPDRMRKEVLGLGILAAIGVTIWLISKLIALFAFIGSFF